MQSTAGRRSANGDWFEKVFGFPEHRFSYDDIRKHMFKITKNAENETILTATGGNGITFRAGQISRPSLGELRHRNAEFMAQYSGPQQDTMNATTTSPAGHHECRTPCLSFSVISGDVQTYHGDPKNKFCTIQVASQLNCLEYVMPGLTPEQGITGYAMDRTQGPACCVCTAPGIAVRNYFLEEYVGAGGGPVVSELQKERDEAEEDGGVATAQAEAQPLPEEGPTEVSSRRPDEANNFEEVAEYLGIPNKSNEGDPEQVGFSVFSDPEARSCPLNRRSADIIAPNPPPGGYTLANSAGLHAISFEGKDYDKAKSLLRIGVHADTQVTSDSGWGMRLSKQTSEEGSENFVTHALCSAAAVSYNSSRSRASEWEKIGRLLLDAAYEATFFAAVESLQRHGGEKKGDENNGSHKLFLTFLGGGVFGNASLWIRDAIRASVVKFRGVPLEVFLVVYGDIGGDMRRFEAEMRRIIKEGPGE